MNKLTSYFFTIGILFGGIIFSGKNLNAEYFECTDIKGAKEYTNNKKYLESSVYKCKSIESKAIPKFDINEWRKNNPEKLKKSKESLLAQKLKPKLLRINFTPQISKSLAKKDFPSCKISGLIYSKVPSNVKLTIYRSQSGLETVLFPVKDYNAHGDKCCYKDWSITLAGTCSNPRVEIEKLK